MANYDLSRLSVLFVEDSRFIRLLIRSVFLTIGLRQIHVANDGRQAIELIKRLSDEQGSNNAPPIDLVISDLVMPGGDGFELLNWIRRDPESPIPFAAFALLTARADADVVAESRNFGANEFIAKPFSANSIASRILAVINTPRQFVLNNQYFGPDRRRQSVDGVTLERRVKKVEDTEVFHSERAPTSLDMKEGRVCFFRLKNSLKERLSGGAGTGDIDADALE
ncbi:MAG: response regulator, partial [Alphaproteobacteria bacterium]|nr:response regulator [Alphaproteobacteria bacterium]